MTEATTGYHQDLSVDQRLALRTAAARLGGEYENWDLDDPAGWDVEGVRPLRDEIERRVRHLIDQLNIPQSA